MYNINIPLISKTISIYSGKDGWKKWVAAVKKLGCKVGKELDLEVDEVLGSGFAFGSFIYVGSFKDVSIVFHESQHALDAIYRHLGCEGEDEMKAYIAGFVNEKLFDIILKEKTIAESNYKR